MESEVKTKARRRYRKVAAQSIGRPKAPLLEQPDFRHLPWLLGFVLAPILAGGTVPEAQALVGILVCLSAFWLGSELLFTPTSKVNFSLGCLLIALPLLQIVPLPTSLLGILAPETLALKARFIEGAPSANLWSLTLSPSESIQRIHALCIVILVGLLVRHAIQRSANFHLLNTSVGIAILGNCLSDLWLRLHDRESILGIWTVSQGDAAAGSFPNRNHFANWLVLAALFLAGWILRCVSPILHCRTENASSTWVENRFRDFVLPVIFALLAIALASASGSRGGIITLAGGTTLFIMLVLTRTKNRRRLQSTALLLLVMIFVSFALGGLAFARFQTIAADLTGNYPKVDIWIETLKTALHFPFLGSGIGTFYHAVNHFKSFGHNMIIPHAENDYLQLLLELGVIGFLVTIVLTFRLILRSAVTLTQFKMREPEMAFACFAALMAFLIHSVFEFVGQIFATCLMAAFVTGALSGLLSDRPSPKLISFNHKTLSVRLVTILIGIISLMQLRSFVVWHKVAGVPLSEATIDSSAQIRRSLDLWGYGELDRRAAIAKIEGQLLQHLPPQERSTRAAEVRALLDEMAKRDPFSWKLRLERLLFCIAYPQPGDNEFIHREAKRISHLYPLNNEVTLLITEALLATGRETQALELLYAVPPNKIRLHQRFLTLLWSITQDTIELWNLTSDTAPALIALGDFAMSKALLPLAAEAYGRAAEKEDSSPDLAIKLIDANVPEKALSILAGKHLAKKHHVKRIEAFYLAQHYESCLSDAESFWKQSNRLPSVTPLFPSSLEVERAEARWRTAPKNKGFAYHLVRSILGQPPGSRKESLVKDLAKAFPDDPRFIWVLFTYYKDNGDLIEASRIAVRLSQLVSG